MNANDRKVLQGVGLGSINRDGLQLWTDREGAQSSDDTVSELKVLVQPRGQPSEKANQREKGKMQSYRYKEN